MYKKLALALFGLVLMGCSSEENTSKENPEVNEPLATESKNVIKSAEVPKNVLLIVADDLGYADIQSYGGEIPTPNLDALASEGVTFNRFYTSLTCSPTRSMLMTGGDNHVVGVGNMAETLSDSQLGQPGYEGYLNRKMPTIAEVLDAAGYHTYMAGKWHLGLQHDQSPRARGFNQSFATLYGAAGHFADRVGPDAHRDEALYRLNGELYTDPFPEDFYSSKNYTDFLIDSIESNRGDGEPFFAYLAYTAPHWPLQAPQEYIDKYKDQFNMGWETIRPQRFEKAKELDVIPQTAQLPEFPSNLDSWESLSAEDKALYARYMEIYAGMVDYMDEQIGRLIGYLKENGLYENTLVIFTSDNGADALQNPNIINFANTFDNSIERAGKQGSYVLYGPPWAIGSSAYLNWYKGTAWEGGIRVPALMSLAGSESKGHRVNGKATVQDVLPTILDYAGVEYPDTESGLKPLGRSLMPLLTEDVDSVREPTDIFGVEVWGHKALLRGDWKIIEIKPGSGEPYWALFNVQEDPGETSDLSADMPDLVAELKVLWDQYVENNGLVIYDGPVVIREADGLPER